jgi:hypothetical protein
LKTNVPKIKERGPDRVAEEIEQFPSKHEALSSKPSYTKKKKDKEKVLGGRTMCVVGASCSVNEKRVSMVLLSPYT